MSSYKFSLAMATACVLGASASVGVAENAVSAPATRNVSAKAATKFTDAQLAEIQARIDLAKQIASNVANDARNSGAPANWPADLMNSLLSAHSSALRNIADSSRTLLDAHIQASRAATQGRAAAPPNTTPNPALGDSADNLVYNPITPCRLIDTRYSNNPSYSAIGPIGTTPVQFDTSYMGVAYGGDVSCYIPTSNGAPAIVANVTLITPGSAAGHLTVRPAGSSSITSWLNWYQAGTVVANEGVIATAINSSGDWAFEIYTHGGSANIAVDFFGYFAPPASSALDCTTTPAAVSLPANSNATYFSASCPAGTRAVTPYCWNGTNASVYFGGSGVYDPSAANNPNTGWCVFNNINSSAVSVDVGATCCKIP